MLAATFATLREVVGLGGSVRRVVEPELAQRREHGLGILEIPDAGKHVDHRLGSDPGYCG